MKKRLTAAILLVATIIFLFTGCSPSWEIQISQDGSSKVFSSQDWVELMKDFGESDTCSGLSAEIVFYHMGAAILDTVSLELTEGGEEIIRWAEYADDSCFTSRGYFLVNGEEYQPLSVRLISNPFIDGAQHITDITASAANALGIDAGNFPGDSLFEEEYSHLVLVFLDAFGWDQYERATSEELIPNVAAYSEIHKAVTVYPPRTSTATAALLTGLMPEESGVGRGGIRSTEALTILDLAVEAGITPYVVEGESLPFNYRNAEIILSGDRDQDGSTDDNVFKNAVDVINNANPRFLIVHFHGIDDQGHTYGPESKQVAEAIREIDHYFGEIRDALPSDTLVIAFADHGMHEVNEGGRTGNHGNLIYQDMAVPIFIYKE